MALVMGLSVLLLISSVGVPERLVDQAAAAAPDPEQSVGSRPIPKKKTVQAAEESTPKVKPAKPVWPKPGKAEVSVPPVGELAEAGALPVKVGQVRGAALGKVSVEALSPDTAHALGGVGVAARLLRADGGTAPGKARAEFSYAGFRDGVGGQFVSRLQVVRLPLCVLQVPRPRTCVARPTVVPSVNDLKSGTLTAEVEVAPANTGETAVKAPALGKDRKADAARAVATVQKAQLAAGSVYLLAGDLTGPDGNWGATDLKPAGTWQAGTSGGGFDYDVPLPEPPTAAGDGPDLSLQYDASSVDGQGRWTNNQSGVVGVGWDLNSGFIERRYRRCAVSTYYDDNTAELIWIAEESKAGRALCWESPDQTDGDAGTNDLTQSELVLSAGGRSAQIVKDRSTGAWKTVPDFGWKIEQVAGGADGNSYWKITNQEGQVWRFGYTKDAQWQVPYVGDENGEPCFDRYWNNAIPPTCTGVWRWNLDQEVDRNENVIDYSYARETNYFCLPSCVDETYKVLPYDRGGFLASMTWGHNAQVSGSTPTARTTFTTAARDGDDVPTDLHCTQAVGCTNDAISFYSTRKLTTVLTESRNPTSGVWDPVDRLDLTHSWMYQRTDSGPPYDSVMWLDTVRQTGLAASPQVALPPLDFDAVMLAGKMDYISDSDWQDQVSWRMVPRVAAIANGMGGRIEVTYGQADPCGGAKGRDGSNYLNDKVGDCYQVDMGSDPENGYEAYTRYYKQLATKVVERDMVGGSPDVVNSYEFLGSPRWAKPIQFAEPGLAPDGSDWRGYAQVRTIQGSGSDPSGYTVTTRTFLRGSELTVTDFDGGTMTDAPVLQGEVLQEQTWQMTSLSPRAYTEVDSMRWEYKITKTGEGPGTMDPAFVLQARERSRQKMADGTWRYTDEKTEPNADGLPWKVNDYGQDGVAGDNSCTKITYARNADPGQWLVDFPSVEERHSGDDCDAGPLISKTITLYDQGTDPATNKPSDGNPTEVRSYADATTISSAKATFDDYGRQLTATDPLGKTTTTAYTPAVGWPKDGITVKNALGHISTTWFSHVLGEPVKTVDANNKTTEMDYDGLGRTTALWKPGQPRAGGTASATAIYDIPFNGGLGQPTAPIKTTVKQLLTGSGTSAKWMTKHSFEDGLGRARESQTDSPSGGRIVIATTYDPRGLTEAVSEPVYNTGQPGNGLLNPALATLPQWTKTVYDGLERQVASIAYHEGTELRRTTTAYPGRERTEVTPPVGGKTVTVADAFDRVAKVEEWSDGTTHADTTYTYDLNDNLTSMTDANGNVRTYTYDWQNRRTANADPDAGNSTYGYDLAGHQIWSIDGKSQKTSITYDDLGRRRVLWAGEPTTGTKLTEWTYDTVANGQPGAAISYAGGQAYTQTVTKYDSEYRVTESKVTVPANEDPLDDEYVFTSAYDAAGNLRERTLPAAGGLPQETLTHSYTDLGFTKGLASNLGGFTYIQDTTFTPTGKLATRALGATGKIKRALERDTTTDWLSRVSTQTKADTSSPDTIQDDRYSYNIAGNITRVLDAASAIPGTTDGQSECFTYDGLLRLKTAYTTTTSSCTGSGDAKGLDPYSQSYTYDKVGNITGLTDNGQTATYTYPAPGSTAVRPNAVTAITRATGTDTYAYDGNGQLAARTVGGNQGTFDWNERGELAKATINGQQTSMVYDASGQRLIRRDPDGSTTLYLGAIELRLANGQVTAKRYYSSADGDLVAMRDTSGVTWMLAGTHGSTQIAVNDTTGNVSRERYLPYGQRRGGDDLPFTDRGFLGKVEDASTGLSYLGARYYDPSIAKFISTDPELDLRTPEWANAYSYAANNPIDQSDPDGRRVDAGGGTDPDASRKANATFAKTHNPNGAKKTAYERKVHKQRHKQYEKDRRREQWIRDNYAENRRRALRKQEDLDDNNVLMNGPLWDKEPAGSPAKVRTPLWQYKIKPPNRSIKPFVSTTKPCSSFIPGTKVLMADGTAKRIEDVRIGDMVLASDPKTGRKYSKRVAGLVNSRGIKNLVRITVGNGSDKADAITATEAHPFWSPDLKQWIDAGRIQPGALLQTSAGSYVQVAAVSKWTDQDQTVYNLSIADIHTYHVNFRGILVHNSNPCSKTLGENLEKAGQKGQSGEAAHHIVAGTDKRADPARKILDRFGIDINDAANGVWLPGGSKKPNPGGAIPHSRVHTNSYYDSVNDALGMAQTKDEAMDILGQLRRELRDGLLG
ncbi:polymorphic toxin-type HINT domain-containing protein [Nonomuraea spiralis]|uniref:Polymorphic toxin-type HINT domain-containing protein n=1 Tax=Nonomuraea spiralis TaxID=46182 RepID=A0ABV5IBF6_9ACTN|nr:polymorphic toxin-type HINT domain-containing protein [Nonomuraea spiralis]